MAIKEKTPDPFFNSALLRVLEEYNERFARGDYDAADLRNAGRLLADAGEYAQAIGLLTESAEREAAPETTYELARSRYGLGDVEQAYRGFFDCAQATDALIPWRTLATIAPGIPSADHRTVRELRSQFADRLRRECRLTPTAASGSVPYRHSRPRLGYVSAFFDRANYMKPVWGLVNRHARDEFDVYLYSDTPRSRGMPGYVPFAQDQVRETADLSNEQLAGVIRVDEIDLLLDLNGYSAHTRLPLFLDSVAPVTAAWFNMYATSGLPGIDVIIGDREVVRADEECEYTEQVCCVPGSYLTFEVGHRAPPVVPPPCMTGGALTFGSLVAQYKITHVVLDAWAEILRRAPRTRLLLANRTFQSSVNRDYVRSQFADRGVPDERLILHPPADHYEYLRYYDQMDVALDAFPYNGGTTTMEAIWQGVPVLTFEGDRWASRTSQSLLRRTPLGDFVAPDPAGYVARAVALATDPESPARLARLRAGMRDLLLRSNVCDTESHCRAMEQLFLQLIADAPGQRSAE